jgi:peptidyl-prolyl cis-trans isomerase B (cyclophilin B)
VSKKRKNSNYKHDPRPGALEKKESRKAGIFGFILAIIGIAICITVAVAMHKSDKTVFVEMQVKDYGKVVLKLDGESAPETVDNFVKLAKEGFYDGLTFHRVVENFMIQGGCPKGNGTGDAGHTIYGEFAANKFDNPIKHKRGVISMARGNEYNSASCQFFICNADYPSLDGLYAAFGEVVEGMEVIDAITSGTVGFATGGYILDKDKQAVIEYIKVLEDYTE